MLLTASHPYPADQADSPAEDGLYYRGVLHELIDMGMDLARSVHGQATRPAGDAEQAEGQAAAPVPAHETAAAFDRISRAVRRTVAMARHVAQPLPARPAVPRPDQRRAAARRQIIRAVEDEIQRTAEVDADALCAELHERLDAPELDDEIDHRPVADVIADICRDLGLLRFLGNHPWKRRRPGDVAELCARASLPPGSQPGAEPPGAAASPGVARCAQGDGETWRPQPYTREGAIELMHQLLEGRPPIRGP